MNNYIHSETGLYVHVYFETQFSYLSIIFTNDRISSTDFNAFLKAAVSVQSFEESNAKCMPKEVFVGSKGAWQTLEKDYYNYLLWL